MTQINPYNFVPLEYGKPDRKAGHPFFHRFSEGRYTGSLVCDLIAKTDIITLDQKDPSIYIVLDIEKKPVEDSKGNPIKITKYHFLRNSQSKAIIQGTSIKGMIRAVFEAMSASCMHFAAPDGISIKGRNRIPYSYEPIGEYEHKQCNSIDKLCPACSLFGVLADSMVVKGRVTFTDAVLIQGDLNEGVKIYKYLSNPKPHHSKTYSRTGVMRGPIAGRKFYYHQKISSGWAHDLENLDPNKIKWCRSVAEFAPKGAVFQFSVIVDNLSALELKYFIAAVELYHGLGHKIGLGKAIGLGSCIITVNAQKSKIFDTSLRYTNLNAEPVKNLDDLRSGHLPVPVPAEFPPMLQEVLRLDKPDKGGDIGYPQDYPTTQTIDALGVFGGRAETLEGLIKAEETADARPIEPPPKISQGQTAAWLKEIYQDRLVFCDESEYEIIRPRNAYQGKKTQLISGRWFVLFGEKASKPA